MSKILFYAERDLHLPFLLPVHDLLKSQGHETVFCAPEYQAPSNSIPGIGIDPQKLESLKNKVTFKTDVSKITADLAVIADNCHHQLGHIKKIVNIGHGLICKGFYYTSRPIARRENLSSLVCVPGSWHKKRLSAQVYSPIEVTGFIKSDLLHGDKYLHRKNFCKKYKIDSNRKIVLFAPTFNSELSCLSLIGRQITNIVDDSLVLIIKLHNMTAPSWLQYYKQVSLEHKNIILLTDEDYAGMMHAADLMVSDISSMFIEFMLMDKPVITIKNPNYKNYFRYDPEDIEYLALDGTYHLEHTENLQKAVWHNLENPNQQSKIRKKYIQELDFGRDGKSALRVSQAISRLLQKDKYTTRHTPITVLIDATDKDDAQIKKTIQEVNKENKIPLDITFIIPDDSQVSSKYTNYKFISASRFDFKYILKNKNGFPYIAFLKCGYFLPQNWLYHLWLHTRWNSDIDIINIISDSEILKKYFSNLYPEKIFDYNDIIKMQQMIMFAAMGEVANHLSEIESAGFMVTGKVLKNSTININYSKNIFEQIYSQIKFSKKITALDVSMYPMPIKKQNKIPHILFYVERSLHLPFLEPIHDYLSKNKLAVTAFSAPQYFAGNENIPGWGLSEAEIERLKSKSRFYRHPEEFKADVTIVADACHFRIPHIKNIINVGHGMICKGAFYTDTPIIRRENLSQMILVPGPWHKRRLAANVFIPIKTTGFIKSDQLFGKQTLSRENFCLEYNINPKNKIILFAPTYNPAYILP